MNLTSFCSYLDSKNEAQNKKIFRYKMRMILKNYLLPKNHYYMSENHLKMFLLKLTN